MINSYDISSKLAVDTRSVDDLRLQAKNDPDQALKEVAKQFEALFVHMMLKSMRDATPKDGMFDSQQTQFYTQMLDQQLAQSMSSKGIGLADMMVKQLTQASIKPLSTDISGFKSYSSVAHHAVDVSNLLWPSTKHTEVSSQPEKSTNVPFSVPLTLNSATSTSSGKPEDFVSAVWAHAKEAAKLTGIPEHFMIAQAALESGWGKHEIRHADNSPSFNLFGIKAGNNWSGAVVEVVTTEYVNGVAEKMTEKFRAYNSYAESFQDYANLLSNNPRYEA
ncbi:MAG: flagellar assembly peptidoglycan hydrolase FlgJ, partial [Nitrosomonas sp.]|nr:flagellar assembly peptidoglycan hydrolase FlgJ [Nitrosomonas sp.]